MVSAMNTVAAPSPSITDTARPVRWPLERVLFAMAGTVTLLSALLAAAVSPWFLVLTALVGVNQLLYVSFRACPASLVLKRFGVNAQCKW